MNPYNSPWLNYLSLPVRVSANVLPEAFFVAKLLGYDSWHSLVQGRAKNRTYITPLHPIFWEGMGIDVFFSLYLAAKYINLDLIPSEGPAILVGNHLSHLDGVFANLATFRGRGRGVSFLIAQEISKERGFLNHLTKLIDAIPVNRFGFDRGSLDSAKQKLAEGRLVGIFPEGKRSRSGNIEHPKLGVAQLALETGVPVIPFAVYGTFHAMPRMTKMIKPYPISIKFGNPLHFPVVEKSSKKEREDCLATIMAPIRQMFDELRGYPSPIVLPAKSTEDDEQEPTAHVANH